MSTETGSSNSTSAPAPARTAGIGGLAHILAYGCFLVLAACFVVLAIAERQAGPPPPGPVPPDSNMALGLTIIGAFIVIAGALPFALLLSALAWVTGVRDWGLGALALIALAGIFDYIAWPDKQPGPLPLLLEAGIYLFAALAVLVPIWKLVTFFKPSHSLSRFAGEG